MIGNNHEIGGDVVLVRLCSVPTVVPAARAATWSAILNQSERRRLHRLPAQRGRAFLVAHSLLRDELSLRLHCRPEEVEFCRGAHGKPRLTNSAISFSLSYSNHWVAAVTTPGVADIGIDIEERCRLQRDPLKLAWRYFAQTEARRLAETPDGARPDLFLRLWTLKGAWIKARGGALAENLPGPDFSQIVDESDDYFAGPMGDFASLRPEPGVALALCCLTPKVLPRPLRLRRGLPFMSRDRGLPCEPLDVMEHR